jgi:hypothetical protein
MPGLVPGIHVFLFLAKDVDGRDKPGHDKQQRAKPYLTTPEMQHGFRRGGLISCLRKQRATLEM